MVSLTLIDTIPRLTLSQFSLLRLQEKVSTGLLHRTVVNSTLFCSATTEKVKMPSSVMVISTMASSMMHFRSTLAVLSTLTSPRPKSSNSKSRNLACLKHKPSLLVKHVWPMLKRFEKASMTTTVPQPHKPPQTLFHMPRHPTARQHLSCCLPIPSGTNCKTTKTFKMASSTSMPFAVSFVPKLNVPNLVSSSPPMRLILLLRNWAANLANVHNWSGPKITLTRL